MFSPGGRVINVLLIHTVPAVVQCCVSSSVDVVVVNTLWQLLTIGSPAVVSPLKMMKKTPERTENPSLILLTVKIIIKSIGRINENVDR